jgi:hypothetical protein
MLGIARGTVVSLKLMKIVAIAGVIVLPVKARADDQIGAAIAGAVIGAVVGASIPVEQRQPAREYIYRDRERPPSYAYTEDLEVGQRFAYGPHGTRELPREYGAPGYHYDVVNRRAVIFEPHTRRIIQVYDPYDD